MKIKIITSVIILIIFALLFFLQKRIISNNKSSLIEKKIFDNSYINQKTSNNFILDTSQKLELPKITSQDDVIKHTGYSLLYDEYHEQAAWVAYALTKVKTQKKHKRTNKFIVDPNVTTGSATNLDYLKSGYDRGHLVPAADMAWSNQSIIESFYYSNMSPQNPSFNRGIWKKLEKLIRTWAVKNSCIYIVTGPVLSKDLLKIGINNVSVPNYFYKVVLDYNDLEKKGIGFILPNENSSKDLSHFAVSIDSVERATGIDFYSSLPDEEEIFIEKNVCFPCWD
jgi:endonuclease G, mitochondrial